MEMEIDDRFAESNPRTCVVLGGRGFLGKALVLRLLKLGKWIVRVADYAPSLSLDPSEHDSVLSLALSSGRASYFQVDVRDKAQIVKAFEGSSVVFYMDYNDLRADEIYLCYLTIVQGAKNVINACRECKVRRLIYNSSADVVSNGLSDIYNGDESLNYPWKFEDILVDLKAQAEALVLFANNMDGLLTCVLRPSNVFGPEDKHFFPFLVNLAKSGWAKFIIGSGENLSDFTYVENVAHAHICAEEALDFRMVSVAGKAFFITNLEPRKFWEFISLIFEGLGYQRPSIKLPTMMVWRILSFIKWIRETLGIHRYDHFFSSPYIQLASCTRTFNCTASQKQIGYTPIVSLDEGVRLTIESFRSSEKDTSFADFYDQSKVNRWLGNGRVADILLWREEKKSFVSFLVLVVLFYWFFLCESSFISSTSRLLLFITSSLYGFGIMTSNMSDFPLQKLSSFRFEISESIVKDSLMALAYLWNGMIHDARSLAQGEDWKMFIKVSVTLYILTLIFRQSIVVVIGLALVFSFTAFFIYEQYETEIDGCAKFISYSGKKVLCSLTRSLPAPVTTFLRNNDVIFEDFPGSNR